MMDEMSISFSSLVKQNTFYLIRYFFEILSTMGTRTLNNTCQNNTYYNYYLLAFMGQLPLVGVGVATVAALSIKSSSNGIAVVDPRAYNTIRRGLDILSVKELRSPLDIPMLGFFDHTQVLVLLEGGIWIVISFGYNGIQISISFQQRTLIDRRKKQNRVACTYRGPFRSSYAIYKFYQSVKYKAYNILTWNCYHFTNDLIERLRI